MVLPRIRPRAAAVVFVLLLWTVVVVTVDSFAPPAGSSSSSCCRRRGGARGGGGCSRLLPQDVFNSETSLSLVPPSPLLVRSMIGSGGTKRRHHQSKLTTAKTRTRSSSLTTTTTRRSSSSSPTAVRMSGSSATTTTAAAAAAAAVPRFLKAGVAVAAAAAVLATAVIKLILDRPSRTYGDDTVAQEYDAWADDGILEYYWGEHIHLGYYSPNEMSAGYLKKNFIQAKYDFIDEMMKFGGIEPSAAAAASEPVKVLDVGCGFGGTSRYLAKALGENSDVTGITLSPKQVERATELANEQGVADRTAFTVMDAMDMKFDDDTFDVVWACESGEHMPDKKKYVEEMMRVLKPGGKFVMACWCQREQTIDHAFTEKDKRDLRYLYEEWTHPYFVSIETFKQLLQATGKVHDNAVKTANWVTETIASWRHSIWVGVFDPRGWIFKPTKYLKCFRDAYCLERMHRAFQRGLMEYGMFAVTKKKAE